MKNSILSFFIISIISFTLSFAQDNNQNVSEYINVEIVAKQFLTSAANQSIVSSEFIATESLDKAKELNLSMALDYDSTGASNLMLLLPANSLRTMSSTEVWEHWRQLASSMEKLDMNIEWKIVSSEVKDDIAFVTYEVKDRKPKVIQLKKENNQWKVVLSFGSIF